VYAKHYCSIVLHAFQFVVRVVIIVVVLCHVWVLIGKVAMRRVKV
jgi:hypothetical protein